MSGFLWAIGTCWACKQLFSFDPDRVPSIPIEGEREPICRSCVELANPRRVANGLDPIVILPGAYVDDDGEGRTYDPQPRDPRRSS